MQTQHILIEGDLDTLPDPVDCKKCGCRFKVLKDTVKEEIKVTEHDSTSQYVYTNPLCCFFHMTSQTIRTKKVTCPTIKCGNELILEQNYDKGNFVCGPCCCSS